MLNLEQKKLLTHTNTIRKGKTFLRNHQTSFNCLHFSVWNMRNTYDDFYSLYLFVFDWYLRGFECARDHFVLWREYSDSDRFVYGNEHKKQQMIECFTISSFSKWRCVRHLCVVFCSVGPNHFIDTGIHLN